MNERCRRPSWFFGVFAAALLCAVTVASSPEAALAQGSTELGLYGGWSFLSADNQLGNAPDPAMRPGSGAIFGGRGSLALSAALAVEAEVDYTLASFGDSGLAAGIVGWRALALWHFSSLQLGSNALQPFVAAGVGAETLVWQEYGTEHDTDISAHLGVGAKVSLSERLGVRLDLRYVAMDGAEATLAHGFEVLIGLMIRPTLAPKDADGDSIVDVSDKCPNMAEDKDGWQDQDGCPDLDNDGDGVPDTADNCPNKAEDKDGWQDADGCPDLDNDGDGIDDKADKCLNKAEDMDGWQDADGCPDLDNDGDGILDTADKCPNKAETFNGVKDEDGCPDGKQTVVMTDRGVDTSQWIYFEAGKSTIQRRSYRQLNSVAGLLRAHPELKQITIEGHTDDLGSADANHKLSQARAEAVMTYLVSKGIAKKRLSAAGFGATRPLCTTLTELMKEEAKNRRKITRCRDQNRRVQFLIKKGSGKAAGTHHRRPVPPSD